MVLDVQIVALEAHLKVMVTGKLSSLAVWGVRTGSESLLRAKSWVQCLPPEMTNEHVLREKPTSPTCTY